MDELFTFGLGSSAVAWLLTYVIHSTVLIGGAWIAVRLGAVGGPEGREALWKTALVAGLLTATVQMVVTARESSDPAARAVWALRNFETQGRPSGPGDGGEDIEVVVHKREAGVPTDELAAAMLAVPSGLDVRLTQPSTACITALRGMEMGRQPVQGELDACTEQAFDWGFTLLALWGLGAALLVFRLARTRVGLRAALVGKVDIASGEAREILDELLASSGMRDSIRLTASPALDSPAVVGASEICLPLRAECALTRSELRVVLAHELGHMARRDPWWTMFSRLLAALFFIQPLNRLAVREMESEAEFLCDDWAVRQTGEPIALARSLTRISEWLTSPPPAPALAVVRDTGTPLVRRVRRILAPVGERPSCGRLRVLALLALLLGATAFAPTVPLAGASIIQIVKLNDAGSIAEGLRNGEGEVRSGRRAIFIRAVRTEVTTP